MRFFTFIQMLVKFNSRLRRLQQKTRERCPEWVDDFFVIVVKLGEYPRPYGIPLSKPHDSQVAAVIGAVVLTMCQKERDPISDKLDFDVFIVMGHDV